MDPIVLAVYPGNPKRCIDLYLSDKELTYVPDLGRFSNLERLWLNSNKITDLVGLSDNITLRELYANSNIITDIVLPKHLEVLSIRNNRLRNLDLLLTKLKTLTSLKRLDLRGNPAEKERMFRRRVLEVLPQLELLNGLLVDRYDRVITSEPANPDANKTLTTTKKKTRKPKRKVRQASITERDLAKEALEISERRRREREEKLTVKVAPVKKNDTDFVTIPQHLDFLSQRNDTLLNRKEEEAPTQTKDFYVFSNTFNHSIHKFSN
ncbi:hypothetical protein PCE1_000966 [Barthelona sp. PCE]